MAESKLSSVLPNNSISDIVLGNPVSTLYANNANISKVLELLQYNNDVEMSFPSVAFGATNTFRFPRAYQFLKNVMMCLDFTFVGANATGILEDYFAYHMIKEIKWQLGGTEQFTIRGESLMHIIMEQCENQEKKDLLLDISGTACTSAANQGLEGKRKFYALLPLPWSTLESKKFGQSQYPLPLHMLNDPLEIQITFRSAAECLGGVQTTNWTFDKAVLNFEYAKVASPTHLKNTVYKFPFTCPFSFTYNVSGTSKDVSIDLNSFRKAELKGISFTYVPAIKATNFQYYNGNKVSDIVVSFNGQIIWKAPHNEMYELIYGKTCNNLGRRKISKTAVAATDFQFRSIKDSNELLDDHVKANLIPFTADDIIVSRANIISKTATELGGVFCDRYYYYIPLSEIKDFSQNYSLGVDVSKQSMNLSFKRSDIIDGGKVYVTYHYTALYQFNGDNAIVVF